LASTGREAITSPLGRAIDAVRGRHQLHSVPNGTDASSLALVGIPTVGFGPDNVAQAPTKDEWIELAQMEMAAEILFRLTREM
jgi:acetylornithine deacetylase